MTVNQLLILIIRIFGLWFLFQTILTFFPSVVFLTNIEISSLDIIRIVLTFLIPLIFSLFLIFKSPLICKWLQLENDDKTIINQFNFTGDLKLIFIGIGLYMIINNLPSFLFYLINVFQKSLQNLTIENYNQSTMIVSGLNVFFGYLIISSHKWLVKLFGNN
jgi:hypothetical protein